MLHSLFVSSFNSQYISNNIYTKQIMKIGIIKERKNPPDRRVVLTPKECKRLLRKFPDLSIKVESSDNRFFTDEDYIIEGIKVVDNVSDCDILLGVKEVPIDFLIPNKKYFFFSHTIKKQQYNRKLLQAILSKNIELFDHEVIVNEKNQRLVAFGRYAGIVGAYNGFRAYGLKFNLYSNLIYKTFSTDIHIQIYIFVIEELKYALKFFIKKKDYI